MASKIVRIYTKDYCPYCDVTKELFKQLGVDYEEIDITRTPEIVLELVKKSGLMTVPQIFVGEKCLGGYDDISKLHQEGKLLEKLGLS